ncbi:MAG: hypothetical protein IH936_00885 [Acidobacteria bacterium]|nr:hypothetical protein [Acidobacteriota bacterium]
MPRGRQILFRSLSTSIISWLALCAVPLGASETASEIVDAMIEAHGGMEVWRQAPTVSFVDELAPAGAEETRSSVTVEQSRRRAYIDFPGTEMRLGWDGEKAWSENWQLPFPPRFLALLNYYFLNLPWLVKDPGVVLSEPETARLFDDPTDYVTIRMTFEAGVGDTPEDYYVLYIHPETNRLAACEYIVTYTSLLPEGAESTNPHVLIYDQWTEVSGLRVPTHYTIYEQDHSVYATCDVSDWSFEKGFDLARMTVPPGAVVDTSTP